MSDDTREITKRCSLALILSVGALALRDQSPGWWSPLLGFVLVLASAYLYMTALILAFHGDRQEGKR